MAHLALGGALLVSLLASLVSSQMSSTKTCGNEDCSEVLFEGAAQRDINPNHEDFLVLKEGAVVKVLGIAFSDRPDLFEGQVGENRGFFYKSHIDLEGYLKFLRAAVVADKKMHVLKREKRSPKHERYVGQQGAARSFQKTLEVEENKWRADQGLPALPTQPPPREDHHGHSHSHGDHSHSHSHSHAPPPPQAAATSTGPPPPPVDHHGHSHSHSYSPDGHGHSHGEAHASTPDEKTAAAPAGGPPQAVTEKPSDMQQPAPAGEPERGGAEEPLAASPAPSTQAAEEDGERQKLEEVRQYLAQGKLTEKDVEAYEDLVNRAKTPEEKQLLFETFVQRAKTAGEARARPPSPPANRQETGLPHPTRAQQSPPPPTQPPPQAKMNETPQQPVDARPPGPFLGDKPVPTPVLKEEPADAKLILEGEKRAEGRLPPPAEWVELLKAARELVPFNVFTETELTDVGRRVLEAKTEPDRQATYRIVREKLARAHQDLRLRKGGQNGGEQASSQERAPSPKLGDPPDEAVQAPVQQKDETAGRLGENAGQTEAPSSPSTVENSSATPPPRNSPNQSSTAVPSATEAEKSTPALPTIIEESAGSEAPQPVDVPHVTPSMRKILSEGDDGNDVERVVEDYGKTDRPPGQGTKELGLGDMADFLEEEELLAPAAADEGRAPPAAPSLFTTQQSASSDVPPTPPATEQADFFTPSPTPPVTAMPEAATPPPAEEPVVVTEQAFSAAETTPSPPPVTSPPPESHGTDMPGMIGEPDLFTSGEPSVPDDTHQRVEERAAPPETTKFSPPSSPRSPSPPAEAEGGAGAPLTSPSPMPEVEEPVTTQGEPPPPATVMATTQSPPAEEDLNPAPPVEMYTRAEEEEPPVPGFPEAEPEQPVGTAEVRDEFGREYCIKENCEEGEPGAEEQEKEHPEDPRQLPEESATPPSPPPLEQKPSFLAKVRDGFFIVRSTLDPLVKFMKRFVKILRSSLPYELQELLAGVDDAGFVVLLIFLPLAFFVHCILGCFESSAGRKRRVKFQHFAKLEGENHTLKIENEQLRKQAADMSGSSAGAEVKMRETAEERRKLESRFEKLQGEHKEINEHSERLAKALEMAQTEVSTLKEERESRKARIGQLEEEVESLRGDGRNLNKELQELREKYETEQDRATKLEADAEKKGKKLERLEKQYQEAEEQLESKQEQLKSTESRLKEARKRLEEVELENVGLKEVVKKLPTHRSSQADACDSGGSGGWSDLGGDVDEAAALQTARMADITNVAQLHARIKTLSTELDRTKAEFAESEERRERLDSMRETAEKEIARLRESLEQKERERKALSEHNMKLMDRQDVKDSDLREKDQRLKHVEEERDSLRLEIERRSREIESLKDAVKYQKTEVSRAQTQLTRQETEYYQERKRLQDKIGERERELAELRASGNLQQSGGPANRTADDSLEGAFASHNRTSSPQQSQFPFYPAPGYPGVGGGPPGAAGAGSLWGDLKEAKAAPGLPNYDSPPSWDSPVYSGDSEDYRAKEGRRRPKSTTEERRGRENKSPAAKEKSKRRARSKGRTTAPPPGSYPPPQFGGYPPPGGYYGAPTDPYTPYGAYPPPPRPPASGYSDYYVRSDSGGGYADFPGMQPAYFSSGGSVGSPTPAAPVQLPLVAGVPPVDVEKPVASKQKPKAQSGAKGEKRQN